MEWVRFCGSSLSLASRQREIVRWLWLRTTPYPSAVQKKSSVSSVSQFVVEQIFTVVYATTMSFLNGLARSQVTGSSHTSVIHLQKRKRLCVEETPPQSSFVLC